MSTTTTAPHALTGAEQADAWAAEAREHWEAGRLAEAAAYNHACRQADPERTPLWQARAAKLLDAASLHSLATQDAVRLAVAGVRPADPGLVQIREHNAGLTRREARLAEDPVWERGGSDAQRVTFALDRDWNAEITSREAAG